MTGDVLLLYTDGLAEARSGGQIFGEDRIAGIIRRDPGQDATHHVQDPARGGPGLRRPSRSPTTWPSWRSGGSERERRGDACPGVTTAASSGTRRAWGRGRRVPDLRQGAGHAPQGRALALQADARRPRRLHGVPDLLAGRVAARSTSEPRVPRRRSPGGSPSPDDVLGSVAHRAVAQFGSAPDWGSGGRGFKSRPPDSDGLGVFEPRGRPRLKRSTSPGCSRRGPWPRWSRSRCPRRPRRSPR